MTRAVTDSVLHALKTYIYLSINLYTTYNFQHEQNQLDVESNQAGAQAR